MSDFARHERGVPLSSSYLRPQVESSSTEKQLPVMGESSLPKTGVELPDPSNNGLPRAVPEPVTLQGSSSVSPDASRFLLVVTDHPDWFQGASIASSSSSGSETNKTTKSTDIPNRIKNNNNSTSNSSISIKEEEESSSSPSSSHYDWLTLVCPPPSALSPLLPACGSTFRPLLPCLKYAPRSSWIVNDALHDPLPTPSRTVASPCSSSLATPDSGVLAQQLDYSTGKALSRTIRHPALALAETANFVRAVLPSRPSPSAQDESKPSSPSEVPLAVTVVVASSTVVSGGPSLPSGETAQEAAAVASSLLEKLPALFNSLPRPATLASVSVLPPTATPEPAQLWTFLQTITDGWSQFP